MFIAELFTIAKLLYLGNSQDAPLPNLLIKKMWYLYTMEFYLATKKNEILLSAGKWIELENIILSKVSSANY
jgi:hypothetical protein